MTSVRGRVIAGSGTCVRFSGYVRAPGVRVCSVSRSDNKNLDNATVYTVDTGTPSIIP